MMNNESTVWIVIQNDGGGETFVNIFLSQRRARKHMDEVIEEVLDNDWVDARIEDRTPDRCYMPDILDIWVEESSIHGTTQATKELIEKARHMYADDDTEIDDNAQCSQAPDGVWVQGWLYLENEDNNDE